MRRITCVMTAMVLAALALGSAGAQSGSPGGSVQAMDDERMQQMMRMMQGLQEQMTGMQSRMEGMKGMGSMHGGMGEMMGMMSQMRGMMQQHREQMGTQCPMGAPQPPPK